MAIGDIGAKLGIEAQRATAAMQARPGVQAPGAAQSAAREFESVFLAQAVDQMLKSVDLGDFTGGHAEETWRSFLAHAVADEIAAQGTTGVAQSVEQTIGAYRAAQSGSGLAAPDTAETPAQTVTQTALPEDDA